MGEAQRSLAKLWKTAPAGKLSPWSQAKAYALREAWDLTTPDSSYGRTRWIAERLYVEGRTRQHPSEAAVTQFFDKVDKDPDWYPGKIGMSGSLGGRPKVLSGTNQHVIARSAMSLKENGIEPTYPLIIAQCPNAAMNPFTGEAVGKQVVYDVLERLCYDIDPNLPWVHQRRAAKTALSTEDIAKRLSFGRYMVSLHHTPSWYFRRVVFTDICNDVLPLTKKKASDQALARKGGSGWISPGSEAASENLRGRKEDLKLCGSECVRVYWMPILARGKLHLELLGSAFPGDHKSGMCHFVQKLRTAITKRFPNTPPDIVFVDRGGGFYDGTGAATAEFKWALRNNQLKAFHGDDASVQPGRSGDLWPHETAVSWTRQRMKRTLPKEPWNESEEDFGKRLKLAQNYVNANYDVDSLCLEMPERMRSLVHDTKGDKLSK